MHPRDLRIQYSGLTAKAHGTNAHLIRFLGETLLQLRDLWIFITRAHFAEQDFLRLDIRRAAVAANRNAQNTRCTSLALRLLDGIQHHLADPCQVAPRAQLAIGQGILRADVFTSAAFEHQLNDQRLIGIHFFKMDVREVLAAEVISGVPIVDRVHGVRAHIRAFGGFCQRSADLLPQLPRGPSLRVVDIKNRRTRILADRRGVGSRQLDVLEDRFQSAARGRTRFFPVNGCSQPVFHILWQAGRCTADQFEDFVG